MLKPYHEDFLNSGSSNEALMLTSLAWWSGHYTPKPIKIIMIIIIIIFIIS